MIFLKTGTKTKENVIKQCIDAHVTHFRTMESQVATFAEALDNVLGEHLSILGEKEAVVSNNFGYCGDCKTTMVLKMKTKKKRNTTGQLLAVVQRMFVVFDVVALPWQCDGCKK